jgi:hypothetical protein
VRQREEVQEVLRHPSRTLVSGFIVLFWLIMMGLLANREFSVRRGGPMGPQNDAHVDSWLGVYLSDDQKIGYIHIEDVPEEREARAGRKSEMTAELAMNFMGDMTRVILSGHAWRATKEPVAQFDFRATAGKQNFRVEGELQNGEFEARVHTAGEAFPIKFPIASDLMIGSGFGPSLNFPRLEVGAVYEVDAFDPLTFSMGKTRIRCLAKEEMELDDTKYLATLVTMTSSGATTRAWIAQNGEVLKVEMPVGFVLKKISPEDALKYVQVTSSTDAISQLRIPATTKKPVRGARRMTVKLSGFDTTPGPPTDATQRRIQDGSLQIAMSSEPAVVSTPVHLEVDRSAYLRSEPLVQSDNPKIIETAKGIVGDETDPWKKALLVYRFVYETLDKVAVWSVPSALEVLAAKEGDCNEHTVLYTALARAAGVPSRIAIGIVWSEEYDGFFYHAWPEVYIDGWIWMDPTLGQPIADATHIKLLTGGVEKWPQLYPYLGQLKVDVLDVQ